MSLWQPLRTVEDPVWVYYRCPNEYWAKRCATCRESARDTKKPGPLCINCWKIEVWSSSPLLATLAETCSPPVTLLDSIHSPDPKPRERQNQTHADSKNLQALEYLMLRTFSLAEEISWADRLVAKISKVPIQVVRTGVPEDSYPACETDYLLMFYAEKISQRDFLQHVLQRIINTPGNPCTLFPVRRGCWIYDDMLRPWKTWYPADQDCPDG